MTHLPLTPGEYHTANGCGATITRIGKRGKWAFGTLTGAYSIGPLRWRIATGILEGPFRGGDITGRVEPARVTHVSRQLIDAWIAKDGGRGTMISFIADFHPDAVRMIEAAPMEAELARVTAQLEHWRQEVGKLHSQVDRLTALNDHADELLDRADVLLVKTRADLNEARTQRDHAIELCEKVQANYCAMQEGLIDRLAQREEAVELLRRIVPFEASLTPNSGRSAEFGRLISDFAAFLAKIGGGK